MSNVLTQQQIDMASNAEPHEILLAIHKRIVNTEAMVAKYRDHAKNLQLELEMQKERIVKLEERNKEEDKILAEPYSSVYGEDETKI